MIKSLDSKHLFFWYIPSTTIRTELLFTDLWNNDITLLQK